MNALHKKSKNNIITLSLIPKENFTELKRSKSKNFAITPSSISKSLIRSEGK